MPRSTLALAVLVSLAVCLCLAAPAAARARPMASVTLDDCREIDVNAASFYGRMRAIAGSRQMWMRFRLLERVGTRDFDVVKVPGLASWRRSRIGARRFNYLQTVDKLSSNSAYRTLVQFRWYDARGARLRSVTRISPICEPLSALPNLRIGRIETRPGPSEGTVTYTVNVRNDGGEARDVDVALRVDGQMLEERRIGVLARRDVQTVEWTAPACAENLRAVVDPRGTVTESDETDNVGVSRCTTREG